MIMMKKFDENVKLTHVWVYIFKNIFWGVFFFKDYSWISNLPQRIQPLKNKITGP